MSCYMGGMEKDWEVDCVTVTVERGPLVIWHPGKQASGAFNINPDL